MIIIIIIIMIIMIMIKKTIFPYNTSQLDMIFYNDTWLPAGTLPGYVYQCRPMCSPPCNNRQECFQPNGCRCLPYFEGKNCENFKPTVYPCPPFPYIKYGKVRYKAARRE